MEEDSEPADSRPWRLPSLPGAVLAGGLVVITAVVAAPQFVLAPHVLAVVLLAGSGFGVAVALLSDYRAPSRTFLVLAIPLVFLAVTWLQDALGLAPHAVLVGLSAVVVGGTVTDRILASR